MQRIRRSFSLATLLAFVLFSGITSIALAQESAKGDNLVKNTFGEIDNEQDEDLQPVREASRSEYFKDVEEFYLEREGLGLVTLVDLENSDGVDIDQIPEEFRPAIESNQRLVAIKIMVHPEMLQTKRPFSGKILCAYLANCPLYFGSSDQTLSRKVGGVEQFSRTLADIYDDNDTVCERNCYGYRLIKQYGWWKRDNTGWTVGDARLRTVFTGDKICVGSYATASRVSTTFSPAWQTSVWSYTYILDGFTSEIIIPFSTGTSRTEGDFLQGGQLMHDNIWTTKIWRNDSPY